MGGDFKRLSCEGHEDPGEGKGLTALPGEYKDRKRSMRLQGRERPWVQKGGRKDGRGGVERGDEESRTREALQDRPRRFCCCARASEQQRRSHTCAGSGGSSLYPPSWFAMCCLPVPLGKARGAARKPAHIIGRTPPRDRPPVRPASSRSAVQGHHLIAIAD